MNTIRNGEIEIQISGLDQLAMLLVFIVLLQGCTKSQGLLGSKEATEQSRLPSQDVSGEILKIPVEDWPQWRDPFTESLIGSSTEKVRDRYGHAQIHANADPPDNPLVGHFYRANENEPSRRWLNVWLYKDKIVDAFWSGYPGLPPSSKNNP